MIQAVPTLFDPKLDLRLERVVDVSPELVWAAWTKPEHLVKWFTPAPWKTVHCEIDLWPGGKFHTTMQSPEGENFPDTGCYLEVIPEKRLVFTSCLLPGYRPVVASSLAFTGIIEIEKVPGGTKYTATALHAEETARNQHAEMGFEQGWGTALDQLVAYVKTL